MGVVSTAIAPPRSTHKYIKRKAIEDLAPRISESRITTICGPAGSGKTTAMLRWAEILKEEDRPVLWLAARAGIENIDSFLDAIQAAGVAAGMDMSMPQDDSAKRQWLVKMANNNSRPALFIDDAQMLPNEVLEFIAQLIASSRDALTTLMATRGEARIDVARMRALGQLVEVDMRHLSFTVKEAGKLIEQKIGYRIASAEIQPIIIDAQGWAAGLVIAANNYRSDIENGESVSNPTGLRHEFATYFHEEVVAIQPQNIRDFIVDTSILDELSPAACAAVTNSEDGRTLLDDVHKAGLFLTAIDRERSQYRYHRLFREMVLGRLMQRAPDRAATLHRRASLFYAANGNFLSAIDHAKLSGDKVFLAKQLNALCETMTYNGYLYLVDELASSIAWPILSNHPSLLLCLAWRSVRRMAFNTADRLIKSAQQMAQQLLEMGSIDSYEYEQLQFRVRHRLIMLAAGRDNMLFVEKESEALLNDLGDEHPYLSCTLLAQLMSARRELYLFHDMLRLEAETRKALGRPGSDFASIALKSSVAPTLVAQGKTEMARQSLEEALELAISMQGKGSGLAALPAMPLAELNYECGNIDRALQLVEQYLPYIRQWGFVDQLASGYLVRAQLAAAAGDVNGALAGLEEAHLVAIECGIDRLRAFVLSEQIRILIKSGQIDKAEEIYNGCDLKIEGEPVPTLHPSRLHERMAIAWLRLEMHRYRLVRSRKVAKRWLDFVRRNGAIRSAVIFELLLAEISVLSGNRSEARRSVRAAVELAERGGWVSPFIDEGEMIASLLVESYSSGPTLDTPVDKFAAKLSSLLKGGGAENGEDGEEEDYGLGSGLTDREVQILTMVNGGLRNREIGDRLGLTEGTVKWYMQQIYDKLGVRRRPQAVTRARQLGILP